VILRVSNAVPRYITMSSNIELGTIKENMNNYVFANDAGRSSVMISKERSGCILMNMTCVSVAYATMVI
jgi:hypothetical protein